MHRIIEVKPLQNFNVWIKFSDSNEGIVDLSDIAGKGVFALWNDPENFKAVFINPENHTISWPGDIDLCPDTLYAEITGTSCGFRHTRTFDPVHSNTFFHIAKLDV